MPLFSLRKRPKTPADLIEKPVARELRPPAEPATQTSIDEPRFVDALTPELLLQLLFDTISAGDGQQLSALCQTHREMIDENADRWRTVPDALRSNPAATSWYADGIARLTRLCAETPQT